MPATATMILPAQRALLTGLIDYAGLFPPAALALEPALDLYGRYRTGDDAWMLGRFLIPSTRLPDLDPLVETVVGDEPVRLSVLGSAAALAPGPAVPGPASDPSVAWLRDAEAVLDAARDFEARHAGRAVCDAFELRLPAALAREADALSQALGALAGRLDGPGGPARLAVETPYVADPDTTESAAHAVADANGRLRRNAFALKFRCGGEVVPGVEALAVAMTAARRAGVAFKATAGLHHPLRHTNTEGVEEHGFLNLFGGAALAHAHDLRADDLAELLDSRDASDWMLGDTLGWRRLRATPEQLDEARTSVALAYGSCSFDEPRDDLRALDWL